MPHYWIAVVRPENLDALIRESGLTSYASSKKAAKSFRVGDRVALYRSGSGTNRVAGFVAMFDVVALPREAPAQSLLPLYPVRIPCKVSSIALFNPVSIVPLLPALRFIKNERHYGVHLQHAWVELCSEDFALIESALAQQFAKDGLRDIASEIEKYRTLHGS